MKNEMRIFKALSDETRLHILRFLLEGEKCVCEILPNINRTQSTVSIHLGKLEALGIVSSRREGRSVYYSITNPKVPEILKIVYHKGSE